MFLGLRSHILPVDDLDAAKAWWTGVLGVEPYFDEPFYVGYSVGGFELGLHPGGDMERGPGTYWGVANVDDALASLIEAGATLVDEVEEPGDGIRMAMVRDVNGWLIGLIENPVFELEPVPSQGPGR